MLIQFSVQNFKSFREKATLSLVASNYDKETREIENIIQHNQSHSLRLLKSAVIYGANASGKTKLIEAFVFMKRMILQSDSDDNKRWRRVAEPFLLDIESENSTSEFEVVFVEQDTRYRYGFEMLSASIVAEWLFYAPKEKEIEVFYRSEEKLESHPRLADFRIGRKVAKDGMIKPNTLWLTAAAKWNDIIANKVSAWFKQVHSLSGVQERGYMGFTLSQLAENGTFASAINEMVKAASIGIEQVMVKKVSMEDLPSDVRDQISSDLDGNEGDFVQDVIKYPRYDSDGNRIGSREFDVDEHESSGTRKYLALSGPILDVLQDGSILLVDELDARLHPNLVCKLVSLFNSNEYNLKGAQLIFNTHDTNLLSSGLFRRDQIWFTEKDRYGASILYALNDYSPRKGENLETNYIQGKYGAIPYLGDFDRLTKI